MNNEWDLEPQEVYQEHLSPLDRIRQSQQNGTFKSVPRTELEWSEKCDRYEEQKLTKLYGWGSNPQPLKGNENGL